MKNDFLQFAKECIDYKVAFDAEDNFLLVGNDGAVACTINIFLRS